MNITASNLRRRDYILYRGEMYQVSFAEFYHPGKGRTVMRTKLKGVKSGKSQDAVFSSNDTIERLDISSTPSQYLYTDADSLVFMDEVHFDQHEVPKALCEDLIGFMKEGQSVYVLVYEGKPVGVIPPKKVILEVTESPDAVKGDTATNAKKEVVLETGAKALVPLFIRKGDMVGINPETKEYLGREN